MDYIDNIYVINLDRSQDRLEKMKKRMSELGEKITRISAIDGKKLTEKELDTNVTFFCKNFCTPGIIGCFLSHRKTWETMIKNKDRYAMILEDDCHLIDNFQSYLADAMNELFKLDPDWDLLYGGSMGAYSKPDNSTLKGIFKSLIYSYSPTVHQKDYNGKHTYIPYSPLGTHCYILSNKCAIKLLSNLEKASYHLDITILSNSSKFNIYVMKNFIGYQYSILNNTSTIDSHNFPVILNKLFNNCHIDETSFSYGLSVPIMQVSGITINLYFILFITTIGSLFLFRNTTILKSHMQIILLTFIVYLLCEFIIEPKNIANISIYMLLTITLLISCS